MAMMMTGRVLLVCALCVLWCLTAFGDATDNRCIEGDGNVLTHTHNAGNDGLRLKADFGLISTRIGLMKVVEAGEREDLESDNASLDSVGGKLPQGSVLAVTGDNETPGQKEAKGAAGAGLPPSMPGLGVSGTGDENRQSLNAGQEGNEQNSLEPKKKEPKESQDQTTDQLPSSSGSTPSLSGEKPSSKGNSEITQLPKETVTKGDVDPRNNSGDDEEREEEETRGESEEEKAQTGSRESQNNGETTPPLLPSSEGKGGPKVDQESSQKVIKVTNEATPSGSKMESEAPEPPSGDATQGQHSHDTDTENSTKNAAAGSPAEPTTSSTSTSDSGDHVQNKADEDDAQSSEEQHDSLETGNTNVVPTLSEEAPRTAETITAARINGTANTQNSDGSTAVSHTTSPLLLFVACPAAAAVAA
ncbi:mucin-associated surface protein (MASP) [Trypanosoma cruzi Dm28c]|uniref:Mucin-associated surface protein (MASP) n=2 Tax=Trypanosoma cruzi TaxID=5693 RepID=V5B2K5_TRYCR|nr:mucin-associated surface protein (MASP) [Trypanosoma cruzi Dm28c]PBJ79064.1 mucin-associated surface protein [Trypanosoma cruzi cruzi]PWV00999.1 Mucin-associated surface protein (MASP) [Trypanosoma cruzi]